MSNAPAPTLVFEVLLPSGGRRYFLTKEAAEQFIDAAALELGEGQHEFHLTTHEAE